MEQKLEDLTLTLEDLTEVFFEKVVFIGQRISSGLGGRGCIIMLTEDGEEYYLGDEGYDENYPEKVVPLLRRERVFDEEELRFRYCVEGEGWICHYDARDAFVLVRDDYANRIEAAREEQEDSLVMPYINAGRKVLRTAEKPRMVYVDTKVQIEDDLIWDEMMKICMEKPIVNMTNWELYEYDGHYNLSGTADRHPRLGNHVFVAYTSNLQRCSIEEDTLVYETLNTIYRCPLKYLTPTPYRNVLPAYKQQLAQRTGQSDSALDQIIGVSAKMSLEYDRDEKEVFFEEGKAFAYSSFDYSDNPFLAYVRQLQIEGQKEIREQVQKENERRTGIAEQYEDCVYLEVFNTASGDKLAYHLGSQTGTVEPHLHSGMFQDSVLYVKYRDESGENDSRVLDFRYFSTEWGNDMETYNWSDNIKRAVIKNMKDDPIMFNQQIIQPGETKVVTPKKGVMNDSE